MKKLIFILFIFYFNFNYNSVNNKEENNKTENIEDRLEKIKLESEIQKLESLKHDNLMKEYKYKIRYLKPSIAVISVILYISIMFPLIKHFFFNKFKPIYPNKNFSFGDLGGVQFIKNELQDIIEYFSNPIIRNKYKAKNISPTKGILFYGPPGTGKTFMAKILANLANLPVFIVKASDILGKFVGEAEKNIIELFKAARNHAPSMIIIDEIDSLLPDRNNKNLESFFVGIINTFLSELDGLYNINNKNNKDILFVGITNRKDSIDPAALRSGRIEKHILIDNPNIEDRISIINIYIKKHDIKFSNEINAEYFAKKLDNSSAASIAEYFNLLSKYLIINDKEIASINDVNEVYETQMHGIKTEYSEDIEDAKFTAYHEAGHAIVLLHSKYSPYEFDILTVIPRGGALGYLSYRYAKGDNKNLNRNEFLNSIDIALGGRAVEEVLFDSPEAGASSDLEKATKIAKIMLIKLGMRGKLVVQEDINSKEINEEVDKILQERYEIVKEIIKNNKEIIHDIVNELMIKKTLNIKDIERIFKKYGRSLPQKTKRNLIK